MLTFCFGRLTLRSFRSLVSPTSHRRPFPQRLAILPARLTPVKFLLRGSACSRSVAFRSVRAAILPPIRPAVNFRSSSGSYGSDSGLLRFPLPGTLSVCHTVAALSTSLLAPLPASSRPRPGSCEIITLASACQVRLSASSLSPPARHSRLALGACPLALFKPGPSSAYNLVVKVLVITDPGILSHVARPVKSGFRPLQGYRSRSFVGPWGDRCGLSPLGSRLGQCWPSGDTRAEVNTAPLAPQIWTSAQSGGA